MLFPCTECGIPVDDEDDSMKECVECCLPLCDHCHSKCRGVCYSCSGVGYDEYEDCVEVYPDKKGEEDNELFNSITADRLPDTEHRQYRPGVAGSDSV